MSTIWTTSLKELLMSSSVAGLSVDCADAGAVARFWADALGREVAEHPTQQDAVVSLGADPAAGPRLAFPQVPEPKTVKTGCIWTSSPPTSMRRARA
jgi:hypothetical protein